MNIDPKPRLAAAALVIAIACLGAGPARADAISGAIFTTTADGQTVNGNNYDFKEDVYLNGGPNNPPGCHGGRCRTATTTSRSPTPRAAFCSPAMPSPRGDSG